MLFGGTRKSSAESSANFVSLKFSGKKMDEHGCYVAELLVDGKYADRKSFFPAHWSRHEVISAIYEVYEGFLQSGACAQSTQNGKYLIRGLTKKGVEIEMFISKEGEIGAAYPTFNGELEEK